jgi:hypothetical protein
VLNRGKTDQSGWIAFSRKGVFADEKRIRSMTTLDRTPPSPLTPVPPREVTVLVDDRGGAKIWNLHPGFLESATAADVARLRRQADAAGVAEIVVDLGDAQRTVLRKTERLASFVDEMQTGGVSIVLSRAPADLLTVLGIEGVGARVATTRDLAAAVHLLGEHAELRDRTTQGAGAHMNQLRLPARAANLALLCHFVRRRLELGGASGSVLGDLLSACYAELTAILESGYPPGEGDFAVSVLVQDGCATLRIVDGGKPCRPQIIRAAGVAAVDRIHRFRIPQGRNVAVLEKALGTAQREAGGVHSM